MRIFFIAFILLICSQHSANAQLGITTKVRYEGATKYETSGNEKTNIKEFKTVSGHIAVFEDRKLLIWYDAKNNVKETFIIDHIEDIEGNTAYACIAKRCKGSDIKVKGQDSKRFWGSYKTIRPDIVLQKGEETYITDTKWKRPKNNQPSVEDLRQM